MFFSCKKNLEYFKQLLNNNFDIVDKSFTIKNSEIAILYIKTLVDDSLLSSVILEPILYADFDNISVLNLSNRIIKTADLEIFEIEPSTINKTQNKDISQPAPAPQPAIVLKKKNNNKIQLHKQSNSTIEKSDEQSTNNGVYGVYSGEKTKNPNSNELKILEGVLNGSVVIFVESDKQCVVVDVKKIPMRSPEEPPTSAVIYGPRVGFTESIETNIAMIRKRLPTCSLKIKEFIVGRYTKTKVLMTFLDDICDKKIVKRIEKQLKQIDIDGIVDSYSILSFFQQDSLILKQTGLAEKPDIITAKILEGRVAILVDNSPIVLTLPFVIFEDIQNSNDYYTNPIYSSFIRVVRLLGILVATISPGGYLALRLYHYKVLPLRFLITISNSTDGLPFTPFIEMIFILILFTILYEVSLRLPRYLGLATSIVGALILGQTGVSAGLISPPGVVIIAMSMISIYTVSDQAPQISILRALFLFLGGTVGLLGIIAGIIYFVNEMATMDKYGSPYLAPYAPRIKNDLKDGVFKKTITEMFTRPQSIKNTNRVRLKKNNEKQTNKENKAK